MVWWCRPADSGWSRRASFMHGRQRLPDRRPDEPVLVRTGAQLKAKGPAFTEVFFFMAIASFGVSGAQLKAWGPAFTVVFFFMAIASFGVWVAVS